jgi:hypothetical protein
MTTNNNIRIKLTVKANGETFSDAEFWRYAGFSSRMPDGENRTWAESKARELFENRSLWKIEDTEWLRSVELR